MTTKTFDPSAPGMVAHVKTGRSAVAAMDAFRASRATMDGIASGTSAVVQDENDAETWEGVRDAKFKRCAFNSFELHIRFTFCCVMVCSPPIFLYILRVTSDRLMRKRLKRCERRLRRSPSARSGPGTPTTSSTTGARSSGPSARGRTRMPLQPPPRPSCVDASVPLSHDRGLRPPPLPPPPPKRPSLQTCSKRFPTSALPRRSRTRHTPAASATGPTAWASEPARAAAASMTPANAVGEVVDVAAVAAAVDVVAVVAVVVVAAAAGGDAVVVAVVVAVVDGEDAVGGEAVVAVEVVRSIACT